MELFHQTELDRLRIRVAELEERLRQSSLSPTVSPSVPANGTQSAHAKEEQIRRQFNQLEQIYFTAPVGLAFLDRELRFQRVNQRLAAVNGVSVEDHLGRKVEEVLPEVAASISACCLEALHTGRPVLERETQVATWAHDGQARFYRCSYYPVGEGAEAIGISVVVEEITGQKQAEKERSLLLAREQEARATAELLNEVGPLLAAELDPQRLVQAVTDIATRLTGAEFGAFFRNVVDEKGGSYALYTLSGAAAEAFADFPVPRNTPLFGPTFRGEGVVRSDDILRDPRYAQSYAQGSAQSSAQSATSAGMPEGHLPVRSYLAAPVASRSGEVLGGLFFGHREPGRFDPRHEAIATGVAAQAAIALDNAQLFAQAQWVQDELKRANQELRRANADLETFAYSASHDLQEPLRNIAICAQLLNRSTGSRLSGEEAQFLEGILDGALRMETLVQDLLSYTRATRFAEGPPPKVDATQVLAGVVRSLKTLIDRNEANVNHGELPAIPIHEVHLAQLFQNLIGNALKYRSKEAPEIHVSAMRQQGWWVFSVADNGIGIDPRYADQIFALFKRLHTRSEYPGSGIGLAICQRIVEQYGGRIWVERSAPGEGSVFQFSIPER